MLNDDRRDVLLEGTRKLIERWGFERYVSAPVVEPTDRFFPDPYTADLHGVRAVARRLMVHMGLEGVHVDATGVDRADDDPLAETVVLLRRATETGIVLDVHRIGPAEEVPLVLTHALARAYVLLRLGGDGAYRAPALDTASDTAAPNEDDERAAFAAGHLGLGLLVAVGAHRYRASGELAGTMVVTRWLHQRLGVLAPDEACFLLAVRAVVQRVDDAAIKRWKKLLGANKRKSFGESLRDLHRDRGALLEALGLPEEALWPDVQPPDAAPLPDDGWQPEERQPVFRDTDHHHGVGGMMFGGLAGVLGLVAAASLDPSSGVLLLGLAGLPGAAFVGYRVGLLVRAGDTCSGCGGPVPDDVTECTGCGGQIRGALEPGQTHLEAVAEVTGLLEELEREAEEDLEKAAPRYVEAGVRCPTCSWIPDGDAHWQCHVCEGEMFNTFAHGGQCPHCDEVFEETVCPACDHLAPYDWWWPEDEPAEA